MHIYIYIYIHTYIHTHTHTHIYIYTAKVQSHPWTNIDETCYRSIVVIDIQQAC